MAACADTTVTFGGLIANPGPSPKWEYKTLQTAGETIESELNALGQAGWELCTASVHPVSRQFVYVLKRLKRDEEKITAGELHVIGGSGDLASNVVAGNRAGLTLVLENSDAKKVSEVLKLAGYRLKVEPDAKNNSVTVECQAEDFEKIKNLLKKLDEEITRRGGGL